MTEEEARAAIVRILLRTKKKVDPEEVCAEATDDLDFLETYRMQSFLGWKDANEQRAEDGLPALSWLEYMEAEKQDGEWSDDWDIPDRPMTTAEEEDLFPSNYPKWGAA